MTVTETDLLDACREAIAVRCGVDPADVKGGALGRPFTIDGKPWQDWIEDREDA
jgi:hypothetical protein